MRRMLILFVLVLIFAPAQAAQSSKDTIGGTPIYGDPARGKTIAERWCIQCHTADPTRANDQIPSLPDLAQTTVRTEDAIRGFLMRPHAPMPPLELSLQQIEDLISYTRNIADRAPDAPAAASP